MATEEKAREERRFAVLPAQSVVAIADSLGVQDLHVDVPRLLAEDATYRLRELLQDANHLMKHSRRKQLTSEDLNKALKFQDVPPVHGHGAPECPTWRQVKDPVTKEADLHFVEDMDVNLANIACSNQVPNKIGSTSIRANWLIVEGHQKSIGSSHQTGKPSKLIGEDLLRYYDNITSAVTGFDPELTKIALSDLRTNPNISTLVPYFLQYVSNSLSSGIQCSAQMKLLYLLQALLSNSSLFLATPPILQTMCRSAMYCLVEPAGSDCQQWVLRDYAAALLANACSAWETGEEVLRKQQLGVLEDTLKDRTRLFSSHYGAIVAVTCFGVKAIDDVILSNLPWYWQHITNSLNDPSLVSEKNDALQVVGALRNACETYLRYQVCYCNQTMQRPEQFTSVPETPLKMAPNGGKGQTKQSIASKYQTMVECFGDSLVARIPETLPRGRKISDKEVLVSLGDEDSHRTGEEMLKEFLQVSVKHEPLKQDSGHSLEERSTESGRSSRSQSDDQLYGGDLTVKATVSDPGRGIKLFIGKRCSAEDRHKPKRQRRGVVKTRMSDVFDVHPLRKKAITFSILRRAHETTTRPVGRPAKKSKGAGTMPRPKINVPPSVYRNMCARLAPYGKKKANTKAVRTNAHFGSLL